VNPHPGSAPWYGELASGGIYTHTDALGSPVARTNASGAVISRTRYEPYGATVAGSDSPGWIGFTGHVSDVDTGLVYMQQRYYDPIAGRFLSVDPVTTNAKDGSFFGRYHYANNNPYKYKDPDGRAFETVWDIASLALSVGQFMQSPSLGNALGVAVDAAAVAIPGIPGGVGALRAMGNAAEAGGRAGKTEVHHVVPQTDKRAAEARDVMKSQGINPKTESTNKVALPGDKHDITKRDSYVRDTNQRVAAQPTADAVKAECCKIADNLQKSTVNELNKQYPAK
jgi:RHS repeat-associated protein